MDIKNLHLHWEESKYKGKIYRSYSLALPYRKNGKNLKHPVVKLGKLSNKEAKRWKTLLKTIKKPDSFMTTMDDIFVSRHYAYLNVALVNAIWDEWGLDNVFPSNGKRDIGIATIARILTINRCIKPKAKYNIPEWFRSTFLPYLLNIEPGKVNSSRIFRELASIEQYKEDICKHLFERMKKENPNSMKSVFYDLSSSCFSGTRCLMMNYGLCKDGFKNHVVLAMVVNKNGLPFYWDVLPGNTADVKTIDWLMGRIKDRFKIEGITLTFDRGMVSDDNLNTLENEEIKYISAMDKNQIEGITGINFTKFLNLNSEHIKAQAEKLSGFKKLNESTYYREIKTEGKRRYILCFNPQLFKDQRKARRLAVENFNMALKQLNAELCEAKKSRNRKSTNAKFKHYLTKFKIKGFVKVDLKIKHITVKSSNETQRTIRTYQAATIVDKKKMLDSGKLDGFWLLVTNHSEKTKQGFKVSAQQAIEPYRDKVVIESAFRDIKSFIEIEPFFVWTPIHVMAHYTICSLSYLINRTLTLRLHKKKGDITKNVVAHAKLYEELSECQIDCIEVENVQKSQNKITRPTNRQEELLNRVGLKKLTEGIKLEK